VGSRFTTFMQKQERSVYVDNLKFVLIFAVVVGHVLEQWTKSEAVLRLLYAFHVPAFAFLAGITSKTFKTKRQIVQLLLVLLVAQIGYALLLFSQHRATGALFVAPYYQLWFLLALVWWKLALAIAAKSRWSIPISVAIALVVGFIPFVNRVMSASRAIVWLPIFLLGYFYWKPVLQALEQTGVKLRLIAVAVLSLALCISTFISIPHEAFYEALSYRVAGTSALFRVIHLLAATLLSLAVFAVIPRGRSWLTGFGERTLSIFVFHEAIILSLHRFVKHPTYLEAFAVAVLVTLLSGLPVLERLLRHIGAFSNGWRLTSGWEADRISSAP
jgi:fucose 4-O-acetylase-like acetyltransferase